MRDKGKLVIMVDSTMFKALQGYRDGMEHSVDLMENKWLSPPLTFIILQTSYREQSSVDSLSRKRVLVYH